MSERTFRDALAAGDELSGAWLQLGGSHLVELVARQGFDWVGIDLQHGAFGPDEALTMLQVLRPSPAHAVVRVSSCSPAEISRALDGGAAGVIVPTVESAEEAAAAVAACRYPPAGSRSWGPLPLALGADGYTPERGDAGAACIVMIETLAGLAATESIVAVPGVDAVFMGPNDLALTAGMAPTLAFDRPEHRAMIDEIVAACRARGVPLGALVPEVEDTQRYREMGFSMLGVFGDVKCVARGAAGALSAARTGEFRTPS